MIYVIYFFGIIFYFFLMINIWFFLKINFVNLICMLNNELIVSKDRLRDVGVRFYFLMYYLYFNYLLLV